MINFDIYIYPNDSENFCDSVDALQQDIFDLQNLLSEKHPKQKKIMNNLLMGNYRGAFALLDGTKRNKEQELITIQKETLNIFNEKQLEALFNVIINMALIGPRDDSVLGQYIGHKIMYEELYVKSCSIFSNSVDDRLRSILKNGAFWQSAALTSETLTSEVLTKDDFFKWREKNLDFVKNFLLEDFSKLNVFDGVSGLYSALDMICKGTLFTSTKKDKKIFSSIDLLDLDSQVINNYYSVVKKIYSNKRFFDICDEDVGLLVDPVLIYLFENEYLCDDGSSTVLSEEPFDPFMKHILKKSNNLQSTFARYLIDSETEEIDFSIYNLLDYTDCKSDILKIAGESMMENSPMNDDSFLKNKFFAKYDSNQEDYFVYYSPSVLEILGSRFGRN